MATIHSTFLRGAIAVALLCPAAAGAQTADTHPWTLQECIDYALAHNLDVLQKNISVSQSEVDIEARQGALFPSLSFATGQNASWRPWSESYVNITDGSMSSTTSTVNYNGTYGLQAQYTLWNGGINRKQVQRSKIALQQAQTSQEATVLDIQEQIARLYVQILYQTEAVNVCQSILDATDVQLQQAQAKYDVGSLSRADLAQVQAQVSQEQYNVNNAKTQLADFKMQLRQLLEVDPATPFACAIPDIDDQRVLAALPAVADVYDMAAASRPELQNSRLGIAAADIDIDIAKRGHYPTVSLQGGINTSSSSGLNKSWADQLKSNLSNQIGLSLSIPIFDNRQTKTNIARAKLDRESAQVTLAQQQQQLYNSIETLWLNATNAQSQFEYAIANVNSMQHSYDLVAQQFEVGLKDIVDLTTAKNNLVQAQQQLLQSKYTAVLNRVLLNFYQGNSLTLN